MGQLGFFDLNRRYESLTEKNDPLVPGETTLTPLILVRVQVPQPVITYLISHYYCLSWKPIFSRICGPKTKPDGGNSRADSRDRARRHRRPLDHRRERRPRWDWRALPRSSDPAW